MLKLYPRHQHVRPLLGLLYKLGIRSAYVTRGINLSFANMKIYKPGAYSKLSNVGQ